MVSAIQPTPAMGVLIVLPSFVAEGCPQLALQLARHWLHQGPVVHVLSLSHHPGDLCPEFETLGIPIHSVDLGHGLARYLRLFWVSFRLCSRLRPVAVLSFPLGWHAFVALGARAAGVRRVCAHVGNLPPVWTGLAFRKFRFLVQLGRPFTHRLICCSEYIRAATVRDFGMPPSSTSMVFNACDLERFLSVLPTASNTGATPRLAMVARLEQHKDHPSLIRAVALLRDQGLVVTLWLIGEGSRRPQLETLIAELSLSDRVSLLGCRRDIPDLLSKTDLFVFSARPDEGFGIALAEAMAAGVPIVATDVGACHEVLDGGRCGLLVPPGSLEALADGIRAALSDPDASARRAAAARERAVACFSVAAMADAYARELGLA